MPEDTQYVQLGTATVGLELHAPIFLSRSDLRRHLYVIGKKRTGKSTLLYNLMRTDLKCGHGFALLDPHGDLAAAVADAVPVWRIPHGVIYLDPSDLSHPIGFNPLHNVAVDHRPLAAAHVVAAFQHIWGASWGPRMEYILTNALRLLLDAPGSTLLGLPKVLSDDRYRACLLAHTRDPNFWVCEFAQYTERFAIEAVAPIQNKVGTLLSPPAIRNMLGQVQSTIDIRGIMDRGQVLIVNLAKGKLGEAPTHLLGAFLARAFAQAAEARADVAEDQRRDFTLYADEFQHFATDSFTTILSEARKYHLALVLAHQFVGQLPPLLRQAVIGNAGSMAAFRIGAENAPLIASELGIAANAKATLASVKGMLAQHVATIDPRDFVFGCTLFGNEVEPFAMGPVTFEPRLKWLGRNEASGAIDAVMARRVREVWRGKKIAKRKKNIDNLREANLLDVVGGCPYVCTVATAGLAQEAAKEKALTAARLALTSIALLWQTPSKILNGMNLLYDQSVSRKKALALVSGKISLAGWHLAYLPDGNTFKPNEWETLFKKNAGYFAVAGEILSFLLSPTGQVNRTKLMNALAQALIWFHQGCRENGSLMATVYFAATLDALAGGGKSGGIKRLFKARLGVKESDPIRPGGATLQQIIDEIYSEARSRTIHGTNDKLGHDWSETKGFAEQLSAICMRACITWVSTDNGPDRATRMSE